MQADFRTARLQSVRELRRHFPTKSANATNSAVGIIASSAVIASIFASVALILGGCRGRVLAPTTADGLRQELIERTRERDMARARLAELETEVARLAVERTPPIGSESTPALRAEAAAATPALAAVGISGLSAAKLLDANTATLALVLNPTDGLGRFLQVVGTVRVSVATLVPGREPLPVAGLTVGPLELRDSYRAGFLGAHYTLELPLRWDGSDPARAVAVSTEFTDALSGRKFASAATIPILPPLAPRTPVTQPGAPEVGLP